MVRRVHALVHVAGVCRLWSGIPLAFGATIHGTVYNKTYILIPKKIRWSFRMGGLEQMASAKP